MQQEQVQAAMVEAGIALEEGDQAQFESIKDPATGAPFTYTQSDNGFQLNSTLPSINDPTVNKTEIRFKPAPAQNPVVRRIFNETIGGETVTLAFPCPAPGN